MRCITLVLCATFFGPAALTFAQESARAESRPAALDELRRLNESLERFAELSDRFSKHVAEVAGTFARVAAAEQAARGAPTQRPGTDDQNVAAHERTTWLKRLEQFEATAQELESCLADVRRVAGLVARDLREGSKVSRREVELLAAIGESMRTFVAMVRRAFPKPPARDFPPIRK